VRFSPRRSGAAMSISRRQFVNSIAGTAALPAALSSANAQAYPMRSVRIVVGYPPGGSVDIVARLIGQSLAEQLSQTFIIENRPGAGSNIGTDLVVKSAPDGYTLLLTSSANFINATLYDKLPFDFIRDIAPVATLTRIPNVMVVTPSVPANSVPEFIAYAKANPGKINMASSGSGTSIHVSGELFKQMANVNMVHVPYRGSAPMLTDLIGGQVQVAFDNLPSSIGHIQAGKLRALAVTTSARSEALPNIPTVQEFVPGFEASAYFGVGAPKNTPPEVIEKLNKSINTSLADSKIKTRFAELGSTVVVSTPAEFGNLFASETEKWGNVIRTANIKPE
jgi:tripartite-type tricarboxylate transporter receptor subunit TctC